MRNRNEELEVRSEENEKSDSFFEKDSPLLFIFAYGIGSVIFIGRMLYGKKKQ